MLKMKLNRNEPINISFLIAKKAIAVVLLIVLFTCIICSCKAAGKNKPVLNTTETTEPSESTYGRMKGVVISGRETETTKTTSETTSPTETTVMETTADTSVPTEQTNPVTPTKAPAKKRAAAKKKPVKRRTTKKKSNKKKSTKKKSTPSQTSNTYKYCTCDAKVSYGVSGMGASGSHTFTGLTAQRNSNGTWKLTSASASTVVYWLNKNVKDKVGKPNWGSYSATITNTRNLRNSP